MDLIADIGATNTRCALLDDKGGLIALERFENREFDGVQDVLERYLDHCRATDRPSQAAIGIAAPITDDDISMVNLPWRFSRAELADALRLNRLLVINDFAAVAWALPSLTDDDLLSIGGGSQIDRATRVALGPGSGLGVATLVPFEGGWTVVAGEGGNVASSPETVTERVVVDALRDSSGYCAAETLISGPGLARILDVLSEQAGVEPPRLTPAGVSAAATRGDPLAQKAQAIFFGMLGSFASDLALTAGARGGIYIAGGIVPRLRKAFAASAFRERFLAKGRHRSYLEAIPTYLITAEEPALLGLRTVLGYR
jgi:glucokinase